jgi:hypothetical protein
MTYREFHGDVGKIIELCSNCPKFLMCCPGITEEEKKSGTECKVYEVVEIDGKKYGRMKEMPIEAK